MCQYQETCATTALYCVVSPLVKINLCLFFRRVFSPSLRSKIMIWVGIVLTAVPYTAFFAAGWTDLTFVRRVAVQTPSVSIELGALSTFIDFYIFVIPLMYRISELARSSLYSIYHSCALLKLFQKLP